MLQIARQAYYSTCVLVKLHTVRVNPAQFRPAGLGDKNDGYKFQADGINSEDGAVLTVISSAITGLVSAVVPTKTTFRIFPVSAGNINGNDNH